MQRFRVSSGLGFSFDCSVADGNSPTAAQVSFTDALLDFPQPVNFLVTSRVVTGGHELTLEKQFTPAASTVARQIELDSLKIVIRFREGVAGADPLLDSGSPIVATGSGHWTGGTAMGLAPAPACNVTYSADGFVVQLTNRVDLPGGLARMADGRFAAIADFDRAVVVLTVSGTAELTTAGASGAASLLQQAFGRNVATQPLSFLLRVEIGASGLTPLLTVKLQPSGALPPLGALPQNIQLTLGTPSLTLPIGSSQWGFRLDDCRIRFVNLPALNGFDLTGALAWDAPRWKFTPKVDGSFALPNVLAILVDRLEWLGDGTLLQAVSDAAQLSPLELQWAELFDGLLPDPLPVNFDVATTGSALVQLVNGALAAGLEVERVFLMVFRSLARGGGPALDLAWQTWFSVAGPAAQSSLGALLLALGGLPSASFAGILAAMGRSGSIDFTALLQQFAGPMLLPRFGEFVALFPRVLAGLLRSLDQTGRAQLAGALRGLVIGAPTATGLNLSLGPLEGTPLGLLFADLSRSAGQYVLLLSLLGPVAASPELVDTLSANRSSSAAFQELIAAIVRPLQVLFEDLDVGLRQVIDFLGELFTVAPQSNAVDQRRFEELMMLIATYPVVGQLASLIYILLIWPFVGPVAWGKQLLDLIINPINPQSGRNMKRFPKGKYIIFSDLHRDARRDDLGPLKLGSIDHFSANAARYRELLDWADTEGYVVLEAGDCEELWYIRDAEDHETPDAAGDHGFVKKLKQILDTHSGIYEKLRKLHRAGRYFRLYGNHDSFLRFPDVFAPLKQLMEKKDNPSDADAPFQIYDFFVIDEAKSMLEHTLIGNTVGTVGGLIEDIAKGRVNSDQIRERLRQALSGMLGMDANDYSDTCPILITHGHQFDVWNSDPSSLAGKMISNAVGVQGDALMDPLLDLRGIANGGNPQIDFVDWASQQFVWSNWPGEEAAVKYAHFIMHRDNIERALVDDIMYWESLAALLGSYFLRINKRDAQGHETTPEQSFHSIHDFPSFLAYFTDHHFHHICVGHTHNPQSQPHYSARSLLGFGGDLLDQLLGLVQVLKSQYLNSGTVGWMEGLIWAIEVSDRGQQPAIPQAKLVFWTKNSKGPEYMDWELSPWDPAVKAALNRTIDGVFDYLDDVGRKTGNLIDALGRDLANVAAVPVYLILAILFFHGVPVADASAAVAEAAPGDGAGTLASFDGILGQLMAALIALQARMFSAASAPQQEFRIVMPLPAEARQTITGLVPLFDDAARPAEAALAMATLAFANLRKYPRGLPGAGRAKKLLGRLAAADAEQPVLASLMALLPVLPVFGTPWKLDRHEVRGALEITAEGNLAVSLKVVTV